MYSFTKEIGRGGMGCVYEGYDDQNHHLAIKQLSKEAASQYDFRRLFDMEVNTLRRMNHPSVVKIVGDSFSDSDGNIYLPMEFVEGETIKQKVERDGPMSENDAKKLMCKILDAVTYIHGMDNVHRDIKPSNIMIRPNGEICIIDFGIAKDMKTHSGYTIGHIIGTDGYMSPEQASGNNIDHRTDIYSLGCLLFYMLTGSHAIQKRSNDFETRRAIFSDLIPSVRDVRPELSENIAGIVKKAVDKNMMLRYQTANDFKNALNMQNAGSDIPQRTSLTYKKISIGKVGNGNDVEFDSTYVSRKHADIEYHPGTDVCTPSVVLIDHSMNGTGVNGRRVHNDSISIPFNGLDSLPDVYFAGRADCQLNWQEVIDRLGVLNTTPPSPTPPQPQPLPLSSVEEDKPSELWCIVAFLMPILGWIMGYYWKKNNLPNKGKAVDKWAWVGFIVNLLLFNISKFL